ncbi:MAG: L-alanine exporter AlaE [Candidatus Pacearchaeota archaeon]|jgi:hypothetical protein
MENNNGQKKKSRMESIVDTAGQMLLSLTGAPTDYLSGLRGVGILAARSYGALAILPTGAFYGKCRNHCYKDRKVTDESPLSKKWLAEMKAFLSFQVPLYATTLAMGSLASHLGYHELKVDPEKILTGVGLLTLASPIAAPGTGLWMEAGRKIFGLDSAGKKARKSLEGELIKSTTL